MVVGCLIEEAGLVIDWPSLWVSDWAEKWPVVDISRLDVSLMATVWRRVISWRYENNEIRHVISRHVIGDQHVTGDQHRAGNIIDWTVAYIMMSSSEIFCCLSSSICLLSYPFLCLTACIHIICDSIINWKQLNIDWYMISIRIICHSIFNCSHLTKCHTKHLSEIHQSFITILTR